MELVVWLPTGCPLESHQTAASIAPPWKISPPTPPYKWNCSQSNVQAPTLENLFLFIYLFIFETGSCSPGWSWTHNAVEAHLDLSIPLPPASELWNDGRISTPNSCSSGFWSQRLTHVRQALHQRNHITNRTIFATLFPPPCSKPIITPTICTWIFILYSKAVLQCSGAVC